MQIDHIFIFSYFPQEAAERLKTFGMTEGASNIHPGQGTACRRFFFENAYLELPWVTDEAAVKSPVIAETRLWERSRFRETGYSPVGLCFRKPEPANDGAPLFAHSWRYSPPYVPEGVYISVAANEEFPMEPMLFEMPLYASSDPNRFPGNQPRSHPVGFTAITRITLMLPDTEAISPSLRHVIENSTVRVTKGDSPAVTIEFDNGAKQQTEYFHAQLPLTIAW